MRIHLFIENTSSEGKEYEYKNWLLVTEKKSICICLLGKDETPGLLHNLQEKMKFSAQQEEYCWVFIYAF